MAIGKIYSLSVIEQGVLVSLHCIGSFVLSIVSFVLSIVSFVLSIVSFVLSIVSFVLSIVSFVLSIHCLNSNFSSTFKVFFYISFIQVQNCFVVV